MRYDINGHAVFKQTQLFELLNFFEWGLWQLAEPFQSARLVRVETNVTPMVASNLVTIHRNRRSTEIQRLTEK